MLGVKTATNCEVNEARFIGTRTLDIAVISFNNYDCVSVITELYVEIKVKPSLN